MKKIILFSVIVMITLTACNESQKIDFTKTRILKDLSKDYPMDIECYASDSAMAVIIDEDQIFGHYVKPVKILFYVSKNKKIIFTYVVPTMLGSSEASGHADNIKLQSREFSTQNKKTGEETILGGEEKIVALRNDLFLAFDNKNDAGKLFETLKNWEEQIKKESNN